MIRKLCQNVKRSRRMHMMMMDFRALLFVCIDVKSSRDYHSLRSEVRTRVYIAKNGKAFDHVAHLTQSKRCRK